MAADSVRVYHNVVGPRSRRLTDGTPKREEKTMRSISHAAVVFARVLVLLSGVAGAVTAHAQGKWTQGPAIPEGANEVIGAAVNGQMLVFGGQDTKSAA